MMAVAAILIPVVTAILMPGFTARLQIEKYGLDLRACCLHWGAFPCCCCCRIVNFVVVVVVDVVVYAGEAFLLFTLWKKVSNV